MAGLPCTVAAILVLALGTADAAYECKTPISPPVNQTPEKCLNKVETGSEMSNEERQSAAESVNLHRAFITNECDAFKSGKPKSAKLRKIRYSCDFEQEVTFTCPANENDFKTSGKVFRFIDPVSPLSVLYRAAPFLNEIEIDGDTLDFKDNSVRLSQTLRFFLNEDAVEIGCYMKACHGKKYIACTTGTEIPTNGPLYTAGTRCRSNKDCLDTGYPICDMELGLCQQGNLPYQCRDPKSPTVRRVPEACSAEVNTGSQMSNEERRFTVEAVNLFRGFITNQCDAFKSGKPKSANLRKVHYNCELEKRAKFECPATASTPFKSDNMFLRTTGHVMRPAQRTATFYRHAPYFNDIDIDANSLTLTQINAETKTLNFLLNQDATEVGCFLKECHGREYMACTTGVSFDWTKPLYTPGNRCQKDADCTEAGYHICDMEYGLCDKGEKPAQGCQSDADCTTPTKPVCNRQSGVCGPSPSTSTLTCKFSVPSLTGDACKDLRACIEATDKTEPEKQFCRSTVIIAEKNSDNSYTVKGFGAAVGEKHLLSSVTSDFTKFGNTDLYAIAGGTTVYQLRAENVIPYIYIGDPNFDAWADLALVELSAKSTFKFNDYLQIKKVDPQDKSLTLQMAADKIIIKEMSLKPDAECEKIFSLDSTITYVPNKNMACGLDDNDKATRYLSGVPLADMALTDGKYTLHGIRSIESLDPQHSNGFLVTKLAPNCNWLSLYSGGAVKCV